MVKIGADEDDCTGLTKNQDFFFCYGCNCPAKWCQDMLELFPLYLH